MTKSKWRLGFHDLYGFNIVMLGKYVWNFVHIPQILDARVLKVGYYPKSHILAAKRSGGSSFIWFAIFAAKQKLKRGFRWVLGDEDDICVGSNLWIRCQPSFMITNDYVFARNMKVKELFYPNARE